MSLLSTKVCFAGSYLNSGTLLSTIRYLLTTAASGTTAVPSMISSAAKTILRTYFERVDWPLNKALPKGAEFLNGPLGDIVKQHGLEKAQVARQLLNYKRGKYTQVSILLNPPDLDERLHEGIGCTSRFVSSTLRRI